MNNKLNMEFLENKIVDADELVDMIEAQKDDENEEIIEFANRIIELIFSHARKEKLK